MNTRRRAMAWALAALTVSGCHNGSVRGKATSSVPSPSARLISEPGQLSQSNEPNQQSEVNSTPVQLVQHSASPSDSPALLLASLPLDRQKNTDPREDRTTLVHRSTAWQDDPPVRADNPDLSGDVAKDGAAKDLKDTKPADKQSADADKTQSDKPDKRVAASDVVAQPSVQLAMPITVGSYTLDQLIALARVNNPAIREAEAAVAKGEGLRYQVGLRPNPSVGYNGTQLADQQTDQHTLFVSQDYVTAQKLQRNTGVLGFEVENLKWQAEIQRRSVTGDVKQLFFETLGAQQKLELSKKFVEMAEKAVDISRQRKKAGEGTEVDVLQSEVQLQQIAVSNRQQAAAINGAWARLAAVVGQADMPLGQIEGELPSEARPYDWEAEYARLCAESPELMAAQTRVARARANIDRQRVQATPNISWMFAAGYDRGTDSQMINTQVGIPLPVNNQNEGNISAAQADYCRALQEVRRLQLAIKTRLASAAQAHQSAAASVELYKTAVIPKAEKMLDLAEMTFKAGEIDFLQVLTIRRTYFDSMVEYLNSRTQLAQANANIEELLLSGSLDNATDSAFDDGLRGQTFSGQ